jgi:hypothetical protein
MPKKYKTINVKPTKNPDKIQIDIPKMLDINKKVDKMEDIFQGYKQPKKNTKKKKSKYDF